MALAESEFDAGHHAVPLDLSALPAGVYLARMHVLQTGHVEAARFTLAR